MKYKARYEAPLTTVEEKEPEEKPLTPSEEEKPIEKEESTDKGVSNCILQQLDLCITILSTTKNMLNGLLSQINEENN